MSKRHLITGILIASAAVPTLVPAADEFIIKSMPTNLDYIWHLLAGALIFLMKSRKKI